MSGKEFENENENENENYTTTGGAVRAQRVLADLEPAFRVRFCFEWDVAVWVGDMWQRVHFDSIDCSYGGVNCETCHAGALLKLLRHRGVTINGVEDFKHMLLLRAAAAVHDDTLVGD